MKGSLIIVSFFILGTLCGFYHLIPYDFTDSKLSYYRPLRTDVLRRYQYR